MDFDFFRVIEYSLIPDSGGAGMTRGGLGIRRRYEILKDGVEYAQYGDRFKFRPEGLFGGGSGALASCTITRDGETTALKSKDSAELRKGDILCVSTGGGAGYGPPAERPRDKVRADIDEGFVTQRGTDES
jgi:N-methylhydantoinase B